MSTTEWMILGGLIGIFGFYLAVVLVWSMVEGVALIVRAIRRWLQRRRYSRGGYVRGASVEAVLHKGEYVIPWSVWPQESLDRFREKVLGDWSGPVDNPSSGRPD